MFNAIYIDIYVRDHLFYPRVLIIESIPGPYARLGYPMDPNDFHDRQLMHVVNVLIREMYLTTAAPSRRLRACDASAFR